MRERRRSLITKNNTDSQITGMQLQQTEHTGDFAIRGQIFTENGCILAVSL